MRGLFLTYPQIGAVISAPVVRESSGRPAGPPHLFVSRYLTALPSADQLKALIERDRARLEGPGPTRGKDSR